MTIYELKERQKELAKEIRELKNKRKEYRGYVPGLDSKRWKYRYDHICYCLARGRKYEEIERNPAEPLDLTGSDFVRELQEATFGKKEEVVNG